MYRITLVLGLVCCVLPALRAEEPAVRYGITGLFGPERQQDLRDVLADVPELELIRIDFDAAAVELRYDMKKLFPNANPKKPPKEEEVLQRLNGLLAPASHGSFRLSKPSTVPADKLTKVEIEIGICDCKACRFGVYRAVTRIDGVERATVTPKPNRVTAWIDGAKTDRAALEDALKKVGATVVGK